MLYSILSKYSSVFLFIPFPLFPIFVLSMFLFYIMARVLLVLFLLSNKKTNCGFDTSLFKQTNLIAPSVWCESAASVAWWNQHARREINNLIACDFYFLCCIIAAGVARLADSAAGTTTIKKIFFGLAVGGRHIIYWQALPADVCFIKRRRGRLFYKIGGIFLNRDAESHLLIKYSVSI